MITHEAVAGVHAVPLTAATVTVGAVVEHVTSSVSVGAGARGSITVSAADRNGQATTAKAGDSVVATVAPDA